METISFDLEELNLEKLSQVNGGNELSDAMMYSFGALAPHGIMQPPTPQLDLVNIAKLSKLITAPK